MKNTFKVVLVIIILDLLISVFFLKKTVIWKNNNW